MIFIGLPPVGILSQELKLLQLVRFIEKTNFQPQLQQQAIKFYRKLV